MVKSMASLEQRRKIYEGKAKILYQSKGNNLIQYFKDDATAFNAQKKGTIIGKGVINNLISAKIMTDLNSMGFQTHLLKRLSWREQKVHRLEMFPLEVIVRNIATGSLIRRLGVEEGMRLSQPIIEFSLKDDKLEDPIISEEHILCFNWATHQEIDDINHIVLRVNDFLSGLFAAINIDLVDFKLELGKMFDKDINERVIIGDEISPDTCRLWDKKTRERLDKDRFRLDLEDPMFGYQEVAKRLGVFPLDVLEGRSSFNETILKNTVDND